MNTWIIEKLEDISSTQQVKRWHYLAYSPSLIENNSKNEKEIKITLERFRGHDYYNLRLKKLVGTGFFTMRTGGKHRLFFTTIEQDGIRVAYIYQFHTKHKYQGSIMDEPDTILPAQTIFEEIKQLEQSNPLNVKTSSIPVNYVETDDTTLEAATFFDGRLIELTSLQTETLKQPFPLMLNGAAGTGKSLVLITFIKTVKAGLAITKPESRPKVLCLATSPLLVDDLKNKWDMELEQDGEGKKDPGVDVTFLTYNQYLMQNIGQKTLVDDTDLYEWYQNYIKHRKLTNKSTKTTSVLTLENFNRVNQVFRFLAGHQDTNTLADRDYPFAPEEKETLIEAYDAYISSLGETKAHPAFSPFIELASSIKYDAILMDESQNATFQQILNVYEAAKQPGQPSASCFNFDSHQITENWFSKRPQVIKMFQDDTGREVPFSTLEGNRRSHPAITGFGDQMAGIKYSLTKGKGDKNEDSSLTMGDNYEPIDVDELQGVYWPQQPSEDDIKALFNFDSTKHFIVTHEKYVAEAIRLFSTPSTRATVHTFAQAIGLEGDRVLLYRPFDKKEFSTINKELTKQGEEKSRLRPNHEAKESNINKEYVPILNEIISGSLRPKQFLAIHQSRKPNLDFFNNLCAPTMRIQPNTYKIADSSRSEDWLITIRQWILNNKNDDEIQFKYNEKNCQSITTMNFVDYKASVLEEYILPPALPNLQMVSTPNQSSSSQSNALSDNAKSTNSEHIAQETPTEIAMKFINTGQLEKAEKFVKQHLYQNQTLKPEERWFYFLIYNHLSEQVPPSSIKFTAWVNILCMSMPPDNSNLLYHLTQTTRGCDYLSTVINQYPKILENTLFIQVFCKQEYPHDSPLVNALSNSHVSYLAQMAKQKSFFEHIRSQFYAESLEKPSLFYYLCNTNTTVLSQLVQKNRDLVNNITSNMLCQTYWFMDDEQWYANSAFNQVLRTPAGLTLFIQILEVGTFYQKIKFIQFNNPMAPSPSVPITPQPPIWYLVSQESSVKAIERMTKDLTIATYFAREISSYMLCHVLDASEKKVLQEEYWNGYSLLRMLMINQWGRNILTNLIQADSSFVDKFTVDAIFEPGTLDLKPMISFFFANPADQLLLQTILKSPFIATVKLVQALFKNNKSDTFYHICSYPGFIAIFFNMLEGNKEIANEFAKLITHEMLASTAILIGQMYSRINLNNTLFFTLCMTANGQKFIRELLKVNPGFANKITEGLLFTTVPSGSGTGLSAYNTLSFTAVGRNILYSLLKPSMYEGGVLLAQAFSKTLKFTAPCVTNPLIGEPSSFTYITSSKGHVNSFLLSQLFQHQNIVENIPVEAFFKVAGKENIAEKSMTPFGNLCLFYPEMINRLLQVHPTLSKSQLLIDYLNSDEFKLQQGELSIFQYLSQKVDDSIIFSLLDTLITRGNNHNFNKLIIEELFSKNNKPRAIGKLLHPDTIGGLDLFLKLLDKTLDLNSFQPSFLMYPVPPANQKLLSVLVRTDKGRLVLEKLFSNHDLANEKLIGLLLNQALDTESLLTHFSYLANSNKRPVFLTLLQNNTVLINAETELYKQDKANLEAMINESPDIELEDDEGNTRLMLAASLREWPIIPGQGAIMKALLEQGAKTEAKNRLGFTPLMIATKKGHTKALQMLVDVDKHLEVENEDGDTALIIAAKVGNPEIIQILLGAGASINTITKGGETALMIATRLGHMEAVDSLQNFDRRQNQPPLPFFDKKQQNTTSIEETKETSETTELDNSF